MDDHVTEYAQMVADGKITAGRLHILACERHLEDLRRQKTAGFPYYWDIAASERVIEYAETLTIAEGTEPRPIRLYGFQMLQFGGRMGWKTLDGFRRFRRSYISMARQNGKSMTNGIMGTYIGNFCGYNYGKLFTVATKKRQARIAWEEMSKFIQIDDDLSELFEVKDYKSVIVCLETLSTIEALSREAGLDDGFRSIYTSLDEVQQQKTNYIYKSLYNGTRSLKETLLSMITTRGFDQSPTSFSYEIDSYAVKILEGAVTADDFFVDIHCLDKGDDYFDECNFVKANPHLARTDHGLKTLRQDAQTAKDMGGGELRDYLTKAMNLWARDASTSFIEKTEDWKACASERALDDMRGRPCYIGIDLSSGGDLTSIALTFPLDGKFYLYSHSFMPRGRLQEHIETDIAPYDIWEQSELITVTGGIHEYKNDYKFIVAHLKKIIEEYDLKPKAIGYDPHNADGFLSDLEDLGFPLLEVTQSARFLNDATVDMRLNIKSGSVEYNRGNELLTWSMTNAKVVANSFGEIKVDKEPKARSKRIDPVDAVIDAHVAYMKFDAGVDVEEELKKYLEIMGWGETGASD
ncbi:MAG: terminase large subunit [Peptococcaceae bacterium]|nr:terminase large subunit [Peptococcaceae bacterium]